MSYRCLTRSYVAVIGLLIISSPLFAQSPTDSIFTSRGKGSLPEIRRESHPVVRGSGGIVQKKVPTAIAPISTFDPQPETTVPATANGIGTAVDLNNKAVQLVRERRFEEASRMLEQAVRALPTTSTLHRNLSIVYESMKKMDEALKSARMAVGLSPDEPESLRQLCGLELHSGAYEDAITCYERLAEIGPLDPLSETSYATAMLRSGKLDAAISILERVATAMPANALSLNALGVAYFQKKKYQDAVQAFKRAVETSPHFGDIRYNLALAHLANRNKAGAISQYRILKVDRPRLAARLYRVMYRDRLVSVKDLKP